MNSLLNYEDIIKKFKLFWQYPVITEKTFYLQNKYNPNYIGIPWATIIDKRYNMIIIFNLLKPYLNNRVNSITCCQHISFRKLIPLFKEFGVTTLYTPHKILGEDVINGINILPCPLYAVNIEDESRNKEFKNVDYLTCEREFLYSFAGAYDKRWYLTNIRQAIFDMKAHKDAYIRNTGAWHFDNVVYSKINQNADGIIKDNKQMDDNRLNYNKLLLKSRFSLCPSGSGPNSIRLWESLAVGAIPVVLADTLELPSHDLWDDTIIRIKEDKLYTLNKILSTISPEKEKRMRENCIKLYDYFKNNFNNQKTKIVHYCCGSYFTGHIGGVARYEYQISKVFPTRVFYIGPQKKNDMLEYLKNNPDALVITDNHLACDIPNEYKVILVHHGVAQTHAEREPTWNEYWKNHCCSGQKKMLYYRNPLNTYVVSISQFCTDEFMKYYNDDYNKFGRESILHCSELDENKKKYNFNKKPIVLGNWVNENKGSKVVNVLKRYKDYNFRILNVRPNGSLTGEDLYDFNVRKQKIYLESDIFLQISLCEGNSFAGLDALLCGLPVVASNVGLFYKDVPDDCFVKLDWERNSDLKYVKEKLDYAWKNREEIGRKGREWYLKNCVYKLWKKKMNLLIENFDLKTSKVRDGIEKNEFNIILIPYRDREQHLKYFLENSVHLLKKKINNLKVVVVEQSEKNLFNRGKLLNIGYDLYKQEKCVYFTHDVDINPYEKTIKEIYNKKINDEIMGIYTSSCNTLGGIIKFRGETFKKINGFPNNIWGWGTEDKALQNRAELKNVKIMKNILNNDPNRDKYFKIFNDVNDRNTTNESKNWFKYYRQYPTLSTEIKERMLQNDGLSTLEYKILKKEKLMDGVEKIVVDI